MLDLPHEICILQVQSSTYSMLPIFLDTVNFPRPLIIGSTVVPVADSLVFMGGSAVCFSFGTYWNKGCFTVTPIYLKEGGGPDSLIPTRKVTYDAWRYLRTVDLERSTEVNPPQKGSISDEGLISIPRVGGIKSRADFDKVLQSGRPVIMENLDIGSCTSKWTVAYLKDRIGVNREVSLDHIFHLPTSP
jgi:tRNA wybutosine-synthesizing protein 4